MAGSGRQVLVGDHRRAAARCVRQVGGECLYEAGCTWSGITDDQRRAAFSRPEGQWLIEAGKKWLEITDEQRRETFNQLEGE